MLKLRVGRNLEVPDDQIYQVIAPINRRRNYNGRLLVTDVLVGKSAGFGCLQICFSGQVAVAG